MSADIYYQDLASRLPGVNSVLEKHFGVRAVARGNHLCIPAANLERMLARDVIASGPQIDLRKTTPEKIGAQLAKSIPDDFRDRQFTPPRTITISKDYGLISDIEEAITKTMIAPENDLASTLEHSLVPLMISKLGARYVTPVSISASVQQAWISLAKVLLLIQRFPEAEALRRMNAGAFDGVLPTALDALAYVDSLTRFSPIHLTLPVYREGCSWHFQNEAMWVLPLAPEFGLSQQFMFDLNPLGERVSFHGLAGLRGMSEPLIWRYLRFVVIGVNRVCKYLNDPGTFATGDGCVDLLRQIQAYSAVRLLFADISAMNYSTNPHHRIGFAMSALDKFANLRVALIGDPNYKEHRAMMDLVSESQGEHVRSILRGALKSLNYDDLGAALEPMIECCYSELHRDLSDGNTSDEAARLSRLRTLRNVRHGTFLERGQFEDVFLSSRGNVPESLVTIPFSLALGMIADPSGFLSFRPTVM